MIEAHRKRRIKGDHREPQPHEGRCTTVLLNIITVDDFRDAEVISPLVASRLDTGIIDRLPELKLIATCSAGYDHIDLAACRERGVDIANVTDYGDATVVEHAKALVANHVLLRFPNVLVTPHNAYNTDAALARIMETTITNIEGFAAGRPVNLVQTDA